MFTPPQASVPLTLVTEYPGMDTRNMTLGMHIGRMDVFFSGQRWSLRNVLYPCSPYCPDAPKPLQGATGMAMDSTRNVRLLWKPKA